MALLKTTMEQTSESGENVSDIQTWSLRVKALADSVDTWNSWYVFLVAIGLAIAAGVFITQFVSIRK